MKKIFTAVGLSLLFACSSEKNSTEEEKQQASSSTLLQLTAGQLKTISIETTQPKEMQLSESIHVSGKIDVHPQNYYTVSTPVGGFIRTITLLPGMAVKKGEVVVVLEDPQYIRLQQDYLNAKVKRETAEKEYQRQKELNAGKAGSDKALEMAKSEFQSLSINARALSEQLKLININPESLQENTITGKITLFAPFNGFVSSVHVNAGKYINASDIIMELINPTEVHLSLTVLEKDLPQLSVGQTVKAHSNIHPEIIYDAKIEHISQDISFNHTAEVHCHFVSNSKELIPGLFMSAVIFGNEKSVLAIPQTAVLSYGGKNYVFVKNSANEFELTAIQIGAKNNGWVEIVQGSNMATQTIVSKDAYTLLMMLKNKSE